MMSSNMVITIIKPSDDVNACGLQTLGIYADRWFMHRGMHG